MDKRWDVLGLGVVAIDDLVYVERYPPYGSKVEIALRQRQGGGLVGTALVAAARLGALAAYGGVLGDDELSRFVLDDLAREGVDCSAVLRQPDARPTQSLVLVERASGQRTIFFSRAGVVPLPLQAVSEALVGAARVLVVDYTVGPGGLRAVEMARRLGVAVVGDIERADAPAAGDLIGLVDHLVAGIELGRQLTGEREPAAMVRALASPRRACCAITAGERGIWYAERGGDVRHQPAFRVEAVDTTGCGDVFHGAYATSIARGEPVERAIRLGAAAAALKAMRAGGRAGIPDAAAVERLLAGQPPGGP